MVAVEEALVEFILLKMQMFAEQQVIQSRLEPVVMEDVIQEEPILQPEELLV
jgi:hypothetical protein